MPQPAAPAAVLDAPVTRRSFVKWSAAAGGAAAAVGAGAKLGLLPITAAAPASAAEQPADARVVWSSCNVNCGSRCPLRMTVVDGQVTRVDPDDTGDDQLGTQQIRACVRGRSIRQRIYSPDRIKYPMKRVGTRGSGEFQRISWDEALDTVAQALRSTIDTYGNEAVYYNYGSGSTGGNISKRGTWPRLLACLGGYLGQYGTYSTAQIQYATPYTYGSMVSSNSLPDAVNAKLVVFWGNNPLETRMSGGGETFSVQQARREAGTRTIVIDPRLSETAVSVADDWVALRPGTDAALVAGMAHVMITEGLHDQAFLDRYCVGFDEDHLPEGAAPGSSYRSYILGEGPDGTAKTPEWAARITGVPAGTIVRVAREIALAKPCAITQGWGPQRHADGENASRAIFMMAIMTGNVGVTGGGTGAREGSYSLPVEAFPLLDNPVKTKISCFLWTDAVERGAEMTKTADGVQGKDQLDVPIKLIINNASNTLINQHSDTGRTAKLLEDDSLCEMVVVIDNQMCASARFADILLPDTTNVEQADLVPGGSAGDMGYVILADKVIDPLFESRTGYDMCSDLARRLGVEEAFTEGRTQEDWIDYLHAKTQAKVPELPSVDELRELGVWRKQNPAGTVVALKKFREDPDANPLETPSGKIEIYSAALQELADTWQLADGDRITALPEYVPTWEGPDDELRSTYPLQMIGHHYKGRTHSSYANVPWLQEAHPQEVWINPVDARERRVEQGDTVQVFNDRGRIELPAKVTARIAPGVVSVPQGAWYRPGADGVDRGGCTNTLTTWRPSALAKGNPQHTNLVQIERA
ncbi:molybdopterin-dependent oxidoreductase [Cellulomonas hominis]|uniref:DMSO/selenate family reductase complex A subunit n=1 Tax=Cellulomonas hominis TaxID=156981 RepID=UPI001C0FF9D2|nr:DMSO/selenate family reductase complex A subunit [Cellulomonas hominis]MBU5422354.1 molybdopterin-dependent oxidoreductase [Cellulomonas hominis]